MSYDYEGSAETRKGKIVYKRKRHFWTACSVARAAKAVGFPTDTKSLLCQLDILEYWLVGINLEESEFHTESLNVILGEIQATRESLVPEIDFQESGSGTFGGAGSMREFWKEHGVL